VWIYINIYGRKRGGGDGEVEVFRSGYQTRLKPFQATFRFLMVVLHQGDTESIYHSGTCRKYTKYDFKLMICEITQVNKIKFSVVAEHWPDTRRTRVRVSPVSCIFFQKFWSIGTLYRHCAYLYEWWELFSLINCCL